VSGAPGPCLGRCAALTVLGGRCRVSAKEIVTVDGVEAPLCGVHARHARRYPVALCDAAPLDRPPDRTGFAWEAKEDAYLVRNAFKPAAHLAGRRSRPVAEVRGRLLELRRRGREEGRR